MPDADGRRGGGLAQSLRDGAVLLCATYFERMLKDEIVTGYPAPTFVATPTHSDGRSWRRGVEAYLNAGLGTAWRIDAAYTYLHARESGLEEPRGPPSIGSASLGWCSPGERLRVTATVCFNGATGGLAFTKPGRTAFAGVRDMDHNHNSSPIAWPLALAAVATLGTLATACMMPFVAVATLAAATMDRPRALAAVVGVWGVNQLLSFGLLGYPMTAYTVVWGVALGVASIAGLLVARRVFGGTAITAARLDVAFAAAFAAYEALLFAFALVADGTGTFTTSIVLSILANDAAWLVGMSALHIVLIRVAPSIFGPPAALRLA